jgi:hypothetical protein
MAIPIRPRPTNPILGPVIEASDIGRSCRDLWTRRCAGRQ